MNRLNSYLFHVQILLAVPAIYASVRAVWFVRSTLFIISFCLVNSLAPFIYHSVFVVDFHGYFSSAVHRFPICLVLFSTVFIFVNFLFPFCVPVTLSLFAKWPINLLAPSCCISLLENKETSCFSTKNCVKWRRDFDNDEDRMNVVSSVDTWSTPTECKTGKEHLRQLTRHG